MQFLIFSNFSLQPFLAWAIILIAHSFAAAWPSSIDNSFPNFPFVIFPLASIGICPDIYNKFPVFLYASYLPAGSGDSGPRSWSRCSSPRGGPPLAGTQPPQANGWHSRFSRSTLDSTECRIVTVTSVPQRLTVYVESNTSLHNSHANEDAQASWLRSFEVNAHICVAMQNHSSVVVSLKLHHCSRIGNDARAARWNINQS